MSQAGRARTGGRPRARCGRALFCDLVASPEFMLLFRILFWGDPPAENRISGILISRSSAPRYLSTSLSALSSSPPLYKYTSHKSARAPGGEALRHAAAQQLEVNAASIVRRGGEGELELRRFGRRTRRRRHSRL